MVGVPSEAATEVVQLLHLMIAHLPHPQVLVNVGITFSYLAGLPYEAAGADPISVRLLGHLVPWW